MRWMSRNVTMVIVLSPFVFFFFLSFYPFSKSGMDITNVFRHIVFSNPPHFSTYKGMSVDNFKCKKKEIYWWWRYLMTMIRQSCIVSDNSRLSNWTQFPQESLWVEGCEVNVQHCSNSFRCLVLITHGWSVELNPPIEPIHRRRMPQSSLRNNSLIHPLYTLYEADCVLHSCRYAM